MTRATTSQDSARGRQAAITEAADRLEVAARTGVPLDGDPVAEGGGAACLGDPLLALAWLARTARDLGDPLRAGQVILSGALGPMVATAPGSVVVAELGPLGAVTATFSGKDQA
jgi:2-keto-4-pentenoate hydratase